MPNQSPSKSSLELSHAEFFIIRTPLLPIEELTAWSDGLTAVQAWEGNADPEQQEKAWSNDVAVLQNRLRKIIDRPEIVHALFIASPSLQSGIEHWKRDPHDKKGLQAERVLVRYFARMCARSTPFGMFAGCSVGKLGSNGDKTELRLKPRSQYLLACRLDFDYLFALTAALQQDPAVEMELHYRPNSSLYKFSDAWHYVESRLSGLQRTHHLVKVESDPYLEAVLERARNGATVAELVAAVLTADGDASPSTEEAQEYVLDLIRNNNLLVSSLYPLLTGTPPLDDIIEQMDSIQSGRNIAESLRGIRTRIAGLQKKGFDCLPSDYEAVTSELRKLSARIDVARLYQVDMTKPVEELVLGEPVIQELTKAVDVLRCLGQGSEPEEIRFFREAFTTRYESAMIPLVEALDEERGVGFSKLGDGADASPLLRGLRLDEAGRERASTPELQTMLLRKLFDSLRQDVGEVELDLSGLSSKFNGSETLANAFALTGALVAPSTDAVQAGKFEIYLHGGVGPSGARLLGRFCYTDEAIERGVRTHLLQEEEHDPDAIYAEVVYLPEGRIGNVLCRPVLRAYEIPYLARSGAPETRRLPIQDLLVGVENGTIVLYSRTLGRQVIPRVTNAHGFMSPQLSPVYRFLCYLQHQHGARIPEFSWGSLAALEFLPRVRSGRLILSLARWTLSEKEISTVVKEEGSRRFAAVQELRKRRRMPRWIVLHEFDNSLPVDLENALSVDAFVHVLKRGSHALLTEMYPSPQQLCVSSSEGSFYHEFNVPFVRKPNSAASDATSPAVKLKRPPNVRPVIVDRRDRILPPGGDWLYLKLYGGSANLDDLLTSTVLPMVRDLRGAGSVQRWFFIRYSDPHLHLRIRFNGPPESLREQVLPVISKSFNPLLCQGKIWKIQFDTYGREIERYGGTEGMFVSEDIFHADSDAVLDILQDLPGDEGLDDRWRVGLLGIHQLLCDFDLDDETKRVKVEQWRDGMQRQFRTGTTFKKLLSEKFRPERKKLELLFEESLDSEGKWTFARQVFERRSLRIKDAVRRLRSLGAQNKLTADFPELATSYSHMFVNRLIRSAQPAHELVLYDFLAQIYDSQMARKRTRVANTVGS